MGELEPKGTVANPNALRATRAYITGLSTSGLLIAAAFMTLFVMSAFVAFNGFPGQDVESPIGNLVVQEQPAPVSVPDPATVHSAARASGSRHAVAAHHRKSASEASGPKASTGLIKHHRAATTPTQAPATPAPSSTSKGQESSVPIQQSTPQLPSTPLPQGSLPQIPLPVLQAPSSSQQPLVNTTQQVVGLVTGK